MAVLNNSNAISPSGYDINNSLRFRSSASAYLNRTPASAGNQKTWTYSTWIKRGALGAIQSLFDSVDTYIQFNSTDIIEINLRNAATNYIWTTTQVFRDPSAWYHIVLAVDTTQATATDRMKLYVNGSQVTAFASSATIPQNTDTRINSTSAHYIGSYTGTLYYLDGYQTEINFVNAQQLTPSSFGETDTTTGSWKPKAYTGTYGTNGFYLKFSDIATTSGSNAGLGKDFSGNANYFNTNNISVTAGTTYDAMIDSPTLTSATVANYAVLNPLLNIGGNTISNANLSFSIPSVTPSIVSSTMAMSSGGKYYAELIYTAFAFVGSIGIASITTNFNSGRVGINYGYGIDTANGNKLNFGTATAYGSALANNDIVMIAYDATSGSLWFGKNGTWFASGNPDSGTNYAFTGITGDYIIALAGGGGNTMVGSFNFGQRPFSYTPPTGFVRLNTYNLPDSTIKKGNTVMDATLYTGAGGTSNITTLTFQPDLIWVKNRSNVVSHCWVDSNRGAPNQLGSDLTAAENSGGNDRTAYGGISTILSNGFTAVSGTDPTYKATNGSGQTYVAWYWKANQGTNTSNTSGSITSTVSVNTTAGFSVVTFNAAASGAFTVGHGLGVAPRMIITRYRNIASESYTYHASVGNTQFLKLNDTSAATTNSNVWNNTSPTSTVFTLGSAISGSTSWTMVAYCWAEIAGYSKFGSYTGNGSADGPMIFTGFKPKFVMVKRTDTTGYSWIVEDTSRNTYNVASARLIPNTSDAESSGTHLIDFLSNGIKLRGTSLETNGSGGTYIVAAFAENPFKNSLAR